MIWAKIDRSSDIPLCRQLHEQLVNRILNGELKGGDRLPSTRQFAFDIGVSRNVIIEVYDQLFAGGFIETRKGSGTFVTRGIQFKSSIESDISEPPDLSESESEADSDTIKFQCGVPDAGAFPRSRWFSCLRQELFYGDVALTHYGDARGTEELRTELCRYLANVKNIRCSKNQIFIVSGTSQALILLAGYFKNRIPVVYIEDPVVEYVPEIFKQSNFRLFSIDVDHQGMRVDQLRAATKSGLIFVSPSHQFSTGAILPIRRRIELIKTARLYNHFIIEDDYDSEFRFEGTPIQSLHMLDPDRVIHLGTFSKTLGAGLRLAYIGRSTGDS
jgi:GntR family transcriptional regulator / MocR family aminotransferase